MKRLTQLRNSVEVSRVPLDKMLFIVAHILLLLPQSLKAQQEDPTAWMTEEQRNAFRIISDQNSTPEQRKEAAGVIEQSDDPVARQRFYITLFDHGQLQPTQKSVIREALGYNYGSVNQETLRQNYPQLTSAQVEALDILGAGKWNTFVSGADAVTNVDAQLVEAQSLFNNTQTPSFVRLYAMEAILNYSISTGDLQLRRLDEATRNKIIEEQVGDSSFASGPNVRHWSSEAVLEHRKAQLELQDGQAAAQSLLGALRETEKERNILKLQRLSNTTSFFSHDDIYWNRIVENSGAMTHNLEAIDALQKREDVPAEAIGSIHQELGKMAGSFEVNAYVSKEIAKTISDYKTDQGAVVAKEMLERGVTASSTNGVVSFILSDLHPAIKTYISPQEYLEIVRPHILTTHDGTKEKSANVFFDSSYTFGFEEVAQTALVTFLMDPTISERERLIGLWSVGHNAGKQDLSNSKVYDPLQPILSSTLTSGQSDEILDAAVRATFAVWRAQDKENPELGEKWLQPLRETIQHAKKNDPNFFQRLASKLSQVSYKIGDIEYTDTAFIDSYHQLLAPFTLADKLEISKHNVAEDSSGSREVARYIEDQLKQATFEELIEVASSGVDLGARQNVLLFNALFSDENQERLEQLVEQWIQKGDVEKLNQFYQRFSAVKGDDKKKKIFESVTQKLIEQFPQLAADVKAALEASANGSCGAEQASAPLESTSGPLGNDDTTVSQHSDHESARQTASDVNSGSRASVAAKNPSTTVQLTSEENEVFQMAVRELTQASEESPSDHFFMEAARRWKRQCLEKIQHQKSGVTQMASVVEEKWESLHRQLPDIYWARLNELDQRIHFSSRKIAEATKKEVAVYVKRSLGELIGRIKSSLPQPVYGVCQSIEAGAGLH